MRIMRRGSSGWANVGSAIERRHRSRYPARAAADVPVFPIPPRRATAMPTDSIANRVTEEFRALQDRICGALSAEDGKAFRSDPWDRAEGGGGIARVIEGGG